MSEQFNETWPVIAKRWADGEIVWSAEMGGIGPGYEQCIQTLIFEILCAWDPTKAMPEPVKAVYPPEYKQISDKVATELDKTFHFSGAQVGQAEAVAYQFIKYGYSEMMNKLPKDRLIQVSKNFPGVVVTQPEVTT